MRPAREMAAHQPLRWFGAEVSCLTYKVLRTAGCCCGFLSGLGCGGGLAAALGLRRSRGRFTDQFGRHDARHEKLRTMIVKIHRGAFLVCSRYDTPALRLLL